MLSKKIVHIKPFYSFLRDKNTLYIGLSATEVIGLLQDIFGLFVIKFSGGIQCY